MSVSPTSFSKTHQPSKRGKRGPGKKTLAQAAFAKLGYSPIECQTLIAKQLQERIIEKDANGEDFEEDLDKLIKVNAKLIEFESARPAAELDLDITTDGEALTPALPLTPAQIMAAGESMEKRLLG